MATMYAFACDPSLQMQLTEIERKVDSLTQHVLKCLGEDIQALGEDTVEEDIVGSAASAISTPATSPTGRHVVVSEEATPNRLPDTLDVRPGSSPATGSGSAKAVCVRANGSHVGSESEGGIVDVAPLESEERAESRYWSASFRSDNSCHIQKPKLYRRHSSMASIDSSAIMAALGKGRRRSGVAEHIWKFLEMPQSSRQASIYVTFCRFFTAGSLFVTFCQVFAARWFPANQAVVVESIIDALLLLEFALRFGTCPNWGTYLSSPHNVIDFLAAAPLALRGGLSFRPLPVNTEPDRILRAVVLGLVPVLRMLKTLRHMRKFHLLTKAFTLAFEALPVLLFFYSVLWLFFSTLIYAIEPAENLPDLYHAMWLTIVSMTTVGYGDYTPKTVLGRCSVAMLAIASGLYMALPIGILGSCFSEVWHDRDRHFLSYRIRGALQMHGFSMEDLPILFERFDKDHDGSLNFNEFHNMVKKLRLGLSDERLVDLFEQVDEDGGGTINVEEFIKFLSPAHHWQFYGEAAAKDKIRSFSAARTDTRGQSGPFGNRRQSCAY